VASETRSSTSTTATLKDFVPGIFGACASKIIMQSSACDHRRSRRGAEQPGHRHRSLSGTSNQPGTSAINPTTPG
jgi:hypothetical protein